MTYSTIYDMATGETITDGVQSQAACDETLRIARSIAKRRNRSVIVEDHGTRKCYRVTPSGFRCKAPASWSKPEWDCPASYPDPGELAEDRWNEQYR